MAGALELRLLGPLEVLVGGTPVALGPPKQRALLIQLAMHAGEPVRAERLIDELWPEDPPASARHALQVYVSGLRKALGDPARVVARAPAYTLRLESGELDLERFRSLATEARSRLAKDSGVASDLLREALSLWRGRALAGLNGEPGVRDVVLELEDERLQVTELLIEVELDEGRHAGVIPELERLLVEYPAREKLYGQLMLALYRSGRQADALEVYQRARRRMMDELGLEPGPQLRALQAAVLRQDPSLRIEPPELRARRHLPLQLDELTGRDRELAELTELVGSGGIRLVTLTGPAGVGKTRLAIATAERLVASFGDGVWFVDLAQFGDADGVEAAIAEVFDVTEGTLQRFLRDREVLLVLDAFQHPAEAATRISRLLRAAPRVKLLATSREPLGLYGEHRYEVLQTSRRSR